jgi:hypothetical protein
MPCGCSADRLDHSFKISHHIVIGETQDPISLGFEPGVAPRIASLARFEVMTVAVHFDDQTRRVTDEIRDVCIHWHLAAKAQTIDTMGLDIPPQQSLRVRHSLTQSLGATTITLADYRMWHFNRSTEILTAAAI